MLEERARRVRESLREFAAHLQDALAEPADSADLDDSLIDEIGVERYNPATPFILSAWTVGSHRSGLESGVNREPYRQVLPDLELSIERFTESVPHDGQWYLLRSGKEVGRFRSLKAAQDAWREVVRASGWKPKPRNVDPEEVLRREQTERWSRNRGG